MSYTHYYQVFGSRLGTNLEFPELSPLAPGPTRWTFDVVTQLPDMTDPVLLGEEHIYGEVWARLYRHRGGHRIHVDDTGHFQIEPDARSIFWLPTAEPWWDFGRGHLLGRVLATALHLDGLHTLHGSAVQIGGSVVGFLGPKFVGKSTLALQLTRAGAALVTDDALPVQLEGGRALAHPGVHTIRLRTLEEAGADVESTGRDQKFRLTDVAALRRVETAARLSHLYLLRSVEATPDGAPVTRVALPGPMALTRLLAFSKIGLMLGASAQFALFEFAAALVRRVVVQELQVVRDTAQLPTVVAQILAWHDPARHSATTVVA